MAKRDKNRSYTDWELDWTDQDYEEDSRKERDKKRRARRLQNPKRAVDDWEEVND